MGELVVAVLVGVLLATELDHLALVDGVVLHIGLHRVEEGRDLHLVALGGDDRDHAADAVLLVPPASVLDRGLQGFEGELGDDDPLGDRTPGVGDTDDHVVEHRGLAHERDALAGGAPLLLADGADGHLDVLDAPLDLAHRTDGLLLGLDVLGGDPHELLGAHPLGLADPGLTGTDLDARLLRELDDRVVLGVLLLVDPCLDTGDEGVEEVGCLGVDAHEIPFVMSV